MSDDDDRERFDYDDRDTSPGAFHERILCECGREYEALVTFHDRAHDSPAWYEPEPGEEKCPACRAEVRCPVCDEPSRERGNGCENLCDACLAESGGAG